MPSRKTPPPDLEALRQKVLSDWGLAPPASDDTAARPSDAEHVFDALCLAGAPRGKTWIAHFCKGLGWRAAGGDRHLTLEEVATALQALKAQGRVHAEDGFGWQVRPEAWAARWPALRAHPQVGDFWRLWVWATNGGAGLPERPGWASVRSEADATALARLVLMAHPAPEAFNRLAQQVMGRAATPSALLAALTQPFDPGFLAELPPTLLWGLIAGMDNHSGERLMQHPGLVAWLDAAADAAGSALPPPLRIRLAERRLHRGDVTGMQRLAAAEKKVMRAVFDAAAAAHGGQWVAASTAFAAALKTLTQDTGRRRGLLPFSLLQWQLWALLAQPDPAAWAAARKLALAESGSRSPSPQDVWGRFAHAAAVRLGDATLDPLAFEAPHDRWGPTLREDDADRVILAAWLGLSAKDKPKGWKGPTLTLVSQHLHQLGLPWKADLLAQACVRLELPVPPRPADAAPAWPVAWFGTPSEAWQDALAAIAALDAGGPAAAREPAATLHWLLTLDAQARPFDLQAYERSSGPRSAGKLKPVSPAALKKRARLDVRDAAVARCLKALAWDARVLFFDLAGAATALIGHPDLALGDAPDQPVQLAEGQPTVAWQKARDGFRLRVEEPLLDDPPPELQHHWRGSDPEAEQSRRNSVRVVRDGTGHARLIRVNAAQRRVAELANKAWAVPAAAEAAVEGTLRVLARHFTLHSDAAGGREVPAEARLVAQLTPRGAALQLRVGVRPFGAFGPLLPPGSGRARVVALHAGESLAAERDLAAEQAHMAALAEALPFLGEADDGGRWLIDEPELGLAAVEALGRLPAVIALEWPQGQPLKVLAPPKPLVLKVRSGRDWFAVDGTLQVDEQQVLSLRELLALWNEAKGSRYLPLAPGAWLALTERLRQQLAELQALGETKDDELRLPAAAAAWLAQAGDDNAPQGDAAWRKRLARLAEAATLAPAVPAALQASLRPYQTEGFQWLVRLAHAGFGAVLADDMGLGKTLQTLALLLQRSSSGPALVVAPTSVVANWAEELQRFAPSLRAVTYAESGRTAALADLGAGDVLLVSYGLLLRDAEAFAGRTWGTLVLDEAQALKNAATQRAKAVAELQADFRLALTGTPVENRLADLWSLMNLLNPGLLGNDRRFAERFGNPIERLQDAPARQRLKRLVAPFILRRTKAQVLSDLPPRTETVWHVEPDAEERALLEALRRDATERVARLPGPQRAFQVLAELTRLRRAACDPRLVAPEHQRPGAKVLAFGQLAADLAAAGHRALVFSQFTDFLDLLGAQLDSQGIPHQRLDGSTPAAARAQRVAAFQRGEGTVFLISLKAGGFGLNLTAADYVVIADPWWNPAAEDQASGRAHRMGQQRPVTVYRLVTTGSVEERIVALHHDKRALADSLLDGQDSAAPLDAEALLALLRE